MKVLEVDIDKIKPYPNNPRHNEAAVEGVKRSIQEFGFKVPLVIDKDYTIVTGHTRHKACLELGITKIPCVMADDLTEQQIKAFRIADNKVSEVATWDIEKLNIELSEINFDMSDFDFVMPEITLDEPETEETGYYGDERERTFSAYNMNLADYVDLTNDFWQMPVLHKENTIPDDLIGFNYALTSENKNSGIHCYVDDYQFERLWNDPDKYIDVMKEYQCMLTPDFSLYTDMTEPVRIWNVYRSHLIGAYYQSIGVKVIPTLQWADKSTFKYCFKGIEKGGVVSVSTVGVMTDETAKDIWKQGMTEALKQVQPKTILAYGSKIDFDFGDTEVIYFKNHVTDEWSERR